MSKVSKNTFYWKYKDNCKYNNKTYEFMFLQNIDYDQIEKANIEDLNFNYRLNSILLSRTELNNKSLDIQSLEDLIYDSKTYCNHLTAERKIPKELCNYSCIVKEYCENMNLELISDNMDMRVDDKLIIGLGNPSVLETSMTIHHVYGVPYLPGQALKGIFRKYFVDEVIENKGRDEIDLKDGISKDLYSKLFGDDFESENEGKVKKSGIVFFDAFPIENYKIDQDIINVHYNNYYQENKFPDGTDDPNLVNFYVVKDTTFKVLFALDKNIFKGYEFLFGKLKKYIKMALEDYGIGAKTAIGYGYLQSINNN
ncbi:type III-B CRISPR module RAMP protein Cmr6 [Iocasia frigidifontis]|uniref:Type III-B CRISPR module RAMP protein Cmr6 n=1 Tax=Iocasia fonsfrigidae TaxID=2682810 RepID=A0A8A7K6T1_9FIRM|nr:type III-B CRISPR module RAMP protein Cmr6 [Iocasia fonsfrigidae]QTL97493.1 type III-B CRISPR module RAMP protein Cmr6 [Iocasia fonsfrigidae]